MNLNRMHYWGHLDAVHISRDRLCVHNTFFFFFYHFLSLHLYLEVLDVSKHSPEKWTELVQLVENANLYIIIIIIIPLLTTFGHFRPLSATFGPLIKG
jgi:hypothetical protein